MKTYNPALLLDFYKVSHRRMYPIGTTEVYSTWTPRASRMEDVKEVVAFGFQAFVQNYLIDYFYDSFFNIRKDVVIEEYKRLIKFTLGDPNPDTSHLEELHDLGYLPLLIKAVPEGTLVPLRVPMLTIENTNPKFFWLTNYIETLASCELWQAATSATIAHEYRKVLDKAALDTVGSTEFVQFQGHDFSFRGMSSLNSAISSGLGHLTSFTGTDTVPAIMAAEALYGADIEKELVGTSIPATEHSIQCAYGDDMEYLRQMLSVKHPSGFVSIVSDGYDFWDVIGRVLPALKDQIMARSGGPLGDKVVIRPDSGDPVLIVCGDPNAPEGSLERKGAVEALWDIFGGTMSPKGYKLLDSHIGLIYGDAITLKRAERIVTNLAEKGFASTNVVFGIGSYTYNFNTRDTFGFALKSTSCTINGVEKQIFKNPKTDDGIKRSQRGRVGVAKMEDGISFVDGMFKGEELIVGFSVDRMIKGEELLIEKDLLQPLFENGKLVREVTLAEIRERLQKS